VLLIIDCALTCGVSPESLASLPETPAVRRNLLMRSSFPPFCTKGTRRCARTPLVGSVWLVGTIARPSANSFAARALTGYNDARKESFRRKLENPLVGKCISHLNPRTIDRVERTTPWLPLRSGHAIRFRRRSWTNHKREAADTATDAPSLTRDPIFNRVSHLRPGRRGRCRS